MRVHLCTDLYGNLVGGLLLSYKHSASGTGLPYGHLKFIHGHWSSDVYIWPSDVCILYAHLMLPISVPAYPD